MKVPSCRFSFIIVSVFSFFVLVGERFGPPNPWALHARLHDCSDLAASRRQMALCPEPHAPGLGDEPRVVEARATRSDPADGAAALVLAVLAPRRRRRRRRPTG